MNTNPSVDINFLHEASYYHSVGDDSLLCDLCAHYCRLSEGKIGICGVRQNVQGKLYTQVYGKVVACQPSPVEKIPLFHFRPGSHSFSIAALGCNFHCSYCTNYDVAILSRKEPHPVEQECALSPEEVVAMAQMMSCQTIAYTYTEPTICYEYVYETAQLAAEAGIRNVFGTNGYITAEPLRTVAPYLAAANVDLKSFRETTHRQVIGAKVQPVLDCLELMKSLGVWLEVTTLVVPTINDSEAELRDMARFISGLGEDTPWHVTRFHPDYKLDDLPVTPASTLKRAREIGLEEGLRHVYTNSSPGGVGEHTLCHECGKVLIERFSYEMRCNNLIDGACPACSTPVDGVEMDTSRVDAMMVSEKTPELVFTP